MIKERKCAPSCGSLWLRLPPIVILIILALALCVLLGLIGAFVLAAVVLPLAIGASLPRIRRKGKRSIEDGGRSVVLGDDEYEVLQ